MQKEIKKRAQAYAIVAVLSAMILGSICYELGVIPEIPGLPLPKPSFLKTFSSSTELKNFLTTNSKTQGSQVYYFGDWSNPSFGGRFLNVVPIGPANIEGYSKDGEIAGAPDQFSTTNIQVAGVDEADIVKNDGEYIYVVTGNNVSILKAFPTQVAQVVSKIAFDEATPAGIFVTADRLVIIGSNYSIRSVSLYYGSYLAEAKTYLKVYDISDKTSPQLLRKCVMTGSYFSSRTIGKYVYFIITQPAYIIYDTVILPKVYSNNDVKEIQPSEIHYCNITDDSFSYTTFAALNMENTAEEPTYTTIMLGYTSNTYVSLSNIYVTFRETPGETSIYRVKIEDNNLTCEAQGKVPGYELNQFSMDEYGDYFRIATTTGAFGAQHNNLYVLNMNLTIVGNLTDIAIGESIHSVRFIGDRCYLVTFEKTDPLFVIDLSDPTAPTILGELWIPGYSDYLHPYDENHLIGIGKETVEAEGGNFAWYQGIKISIFDVTNVSNPIQMAKYIIGDRGTDSPILTDHKAFLFSKARDLLVIPVTVAKIDPAQYYQSEVPGSAYGTQIWQGAYVFNITLTDGLVLRGNITHGEGAGLPESKYWVKRALYIEDVLYTVSDGKVKLNSLDDLAFIKEIKLN